jgi:hypothetical protein
VNLIVDLSMGDRLFSLILGEEGVLFSGGTIWLAVVDDMRTGDAWGSTEDGATVL